MKRIFYRTIETGDVDTEDGGRAKILQIDGDDDSALFVRLQSWDETKAHPEFAELVGKRIRVTIEVID